MRRDLAQCRTGVFVASAEPDVIHQALSKIGRSFPQVSFTFLVPKCYAGAFSWPGQVIWMEQVKMSPLRWLASLRKRRFDLCVVLFAGRPTFRKTKLAGLFLNAGTIVVTNENGDFFAIDRAHWKLVLAHLGNRLQNYRPPKLLFPVGFVYLVARAWWLTARAKKRAGPGNNEPSRAVPGTSSRFREPLMEGGGMTSRQDDTAATGIRTSTSRSSR